MVGLGPGGPLDRTRRAELAIAASEVIVGYSRYVASIADLTAGKEVLSSGMRQEVDRCRLALRRAADGATVALVSSGDAGIYGMAGLTIELAEAEKLHVDIEIVPGVTAAAGAAGRMGAPLMLDFAVISLSDLLIPWPTIRARLEAVAAADLVVALYNPKSAKRVAQLDETLGIFRQHRPPKTPVGLGINLGSADERIVLTDLAGVPTDQIDMRTVVIIGNSTSRVLAGWFVTARGYRTK